jgi:hypothetical protein
LGKLWHESGAERRKIFDVPVFLTDTVAENTGRVHDIDQLRL